LSNTLQLQILPNRTQLIWEHLAHIAQCGETRHSTLEHIRNIQLVRHQRRYISGLQTPRRRLLGVARLARLRKQAQAAAQRRIMASRAVQGLGINLPDRKAQMSCSDLTTAEIPVLAQMHQAQEWPYAFPDLEHEQFVTKRVLHDEDGGLVGCVVARKTVELFFIGNPQWRTPKWRMEALTMLHEDTRRELRERGYMDGHCWIPPQVRNFGRRLKRMGWSLNPWDCWSRET
jgi:hypothetical protein